MLSDASPDAVVDLSYQYRMNEDIMLLSNRLIYDNKLKCGSESVAQQALVLREPKTCVGMFTTCHPEALSSCWIQDLMEERWDCVPSFIPPRSALSSLYAESRLCLWIRIWYRLTIQELGIWYITRWKQSLFFRYVWVLTMTIKAAQTACTGCSSSCSHAQFAHALTSCGIKPTDIAVITPYRQQIKLLTSLFSSLPTVEILTADKSQGRDKDCILISLVRSNEHGNVSFS
jgi:DNA replication ATP-dependent helicase Dna2